METENGLPANSASAFENASSTDLTGISLSGFDGKIGGMDECSSDEMMGFLRRMAAVFPTNATPTPETHQVYLKALAGYSKAQIIGAFGRWIRDGRRFPYPADLIGMID